MTSVSAARHLVLQHAKPLEPTILPLQQAAGLTLAADVYSGNDFPPFRQSSMDGYAFCFKRWNRQPLKIEGLVQAGASEQIIVPANVAVRIFTGAPLPDGLDTVVMQEKVEVEHNMLHINDDTLQHRSNVRLQGAEISNGSLALEKGTLLSPGAIGFIAGLGIAAVQVYPKPQVAIIVTGKELQQLGKPLQFGQVYESNSYALTAVLAQAGITGVTILQADDHLDELTAVVEKSLANANLLLLTGGVSVGAFDFVAKALDANGVTKIFHSIKQRPGKPLLFGTKGEKLVFGLPGNPSSVLTCFYEYVLLAIQQLTGAQQPLIKKVQMPLASDYIKAPGLTHFLKGQRMNDTVLPLTAQESYKMRSFAIADCLVVLEEERSEYKKGDLVEVHLLV